MLKIQPRFYRPKHFVCEESMHWDKMVVISRFAGRDVLSDLCSRKHSASYIHARQARQDARQGRHYRYAIPPQDFFDCFLGHLFLRERAQFNGVRDTHNTSPQYFLKDLLWRWVTSIGLHASKKSWLRRLCSQYKIIWIDALARKNVTLPPPANTVWA